MAILALVLVVALLIPLAGILADSPIGRALARRLEGPALPAADTVALAKRVELLEGEVDDLTRAMEAMKEEQQFLQRLLEEQPGRGALRPPRDT